MQGLVAGILIAVVAIKLLGGKGEASVPASNRFPWLDSPAKIEFLAYVKTRTKDPAVTATAMHQYWKDFKQVKGLQGYRI